jgi:hypothetical protein
MEIIKIAKNQFMIFYFLFSLRNNQFFPTFIITGFSLSFYIFKLILSQLFLFIISTNIFIPYGKRFLYQDFFMNKI